MDEFEDIGRVGGNARAIMALEHGYTVKPHERGRNHSTETYIIGDYHVWRIREGWQTARLTNGWYCRHAPYDTFIEAILSN